MSPTADTVAQAEPGVTSSPAETPLAVQRLDAEPAVAVQGPVPATDRSPAIPAVAVASEDSSEHSEHSGDDTAASTCGSVTSAELESKVDEGKGESRAAPVVDEDNSEVIPGSQVHDAVETGSAVAEQGDVDTEAVSATPEADGYGVTAAPDEAATGPNPEAARDPASPETTPTANENVQAAAVEQAAASTRPTAHDAVTANRTGAIAREADTSTSEGESDNPRTPASLEQAASSPGARNTNSNSSGDFTSRRSENTPQGPRQAATVTRPPRNRNNQNRFVDSNVNAPFRDHGNEVARANAQIQRLQTELSQARQHNAQANQEMEEKVRSHMVAAISSMSADLVAKTAALFEAEALVKSQENMLRHRERGIEQLEGFLAEGQRMLMSGIDAAGANTWSARHYAYICRAADIGAYQNLAEQRLRVEQRSREISARDAALKIREGATLAMFREQWEKEVMEAPSGLIKKALEDEFERGWEASRAALGVVGEGTLDVGAREREKMYWQGYQACQAQQARLAMGMAGRGGEEDRAQEVHNRLPVQQQPPRQVPTRPEPLTFAAELRLGLIGPNGVDRTAARYPPLPRGQPSSLFQDNLIDFE